jgi:hypothetical protein
MFLMIDKIFQPSASQPVSLRAIENRCLSRTFLALWRFGGSK